MNTPDEGPSPREWTFNGEVVNMQTYEEMICQGAMRIMEKNKAVGDGKQWEGFTLGRWAETWVVCRGARCDHLNKAHSRSCGLTSRKELGRTSVWLEGRQGGTSGGRWGWRVGRDTDCVGAGLYSQAWQEAIGGFWAGEKHALKWGARPARKHGHQLKGAQPGYALKGADRTPWGVGCRGWGKGSKDGA